MSYLFVSDMNITISGYAETSMYITSFDDCIYWPTAASEFDVRGKLAVLNAAFKLQCHAFWVIMWTARYSWRHLCVCVLNRCHSIIYNANFSKIVVLGVGRIKRKMKQLDHQSYHGGIEISFNCGWVESTLDQSRFFL